MEKQFEESNISNFNRGNVDGTYGMWQRRFILRHHLFFGPLLGLVEEAGGLFAGAEQLKVQRFIIRRGKHPLPCLVGDSLPRAEAKNQKRNQIL